MPVYVNVGNVGIIIFLISPTRVNGDGMDLTVPSHSGLYRSILLTYFLRCERPLSIYVRFIDLRPHPPPILCTTSAQLPVYIRIQASAGSSMLCSSYYVTLIGRLTSLHQESSLASINFCCILHRSIQVHAGFVFKP